MISYQTLYAKYDTTLHKNATHCGIAEKKARSELCAIQQFMLPKNTSEKKDDQKSNGFARMEKCRQGLDALDKAGWKRSYHQRKFHDAFIAACARAFFKLDEPGSFQRAYQHVLEINGWSNLNQEILISTPRRFGRPPPPLEAPTPCSYPVRPRLQVKPSVCRCLQQRCCTRVQASNSVSTVLAKGSRR